MRQKKKKMQCCVQRQNKKRLLVFNYHLFFKKHFPPVHILINHIRDAEGC